MLKDGSIIARGVVRVAVVGQKEGGMMGMQTSGTLEAGNRGKSLKAIL